jgi:hypothetical protein
MYMRPTYRWLLPILLVFFLFSIGHAAEVTLEWDCNNESRAEGFRIFIKEGAIIQHKDENLVILSVNAETPGFDINNPNFTISELADNVTYYFAVTTLDGIGNESAFSNQVAARNGVEVPIDESSSSSSSAAAGCLIDVLTP